MVVDTVDWKLIGSCNIRCLHCYGPKKTDKALPKNKLMDIVEIYGRMGIEWVVLTGGEPLLVEGIDDIMKSLDERGISIGLSTNTAFFDKHAEAIEKYVSSLNIPLDGSTPEIHARSRDDTTTYESFFRVLEHYMKPKSKKPDLLRVGTVVSRANRGDLINIAHRLKPYMEIIDTWKIYELIDYEFQPALRKPILGDGQEFEEELKGLFSQDNPLRSKIKIARAKARDRAYFMVNPKGIVVVPTDIDGRTYEIGIGSILEQPLDGVIARWEEYVSRKNYLQNHALHYQRSV